MPNKPGPPLSSLIHLHPKETKPTVTLGIHLTPINDKPLRDGSFHFRDRARGLGVDIRRNAVAAMHDECTLIHAGLRGCNEVEMVCTAGPGCEDVCIWMEDGFEVFPLAGISG